MLATALGRCCAAKNGRFRLILPAGLGAAFKRSVADAAKAAGGYGVVVGGRPDLGEISAGHAIAYRTPDAAQLLSVILIASEGDARELKSLEGFRPMLVDGLPGNLDDQTANHAVLSLDDLCESVARELSGGSGCDPDFLGPALLFVARFLGKAYKLQGGAETSWVEAFWCHLDRMCTRLPKALDLIMPGHPQRAGLAAHLAAGLPLPDEGGRYQSSHSPQVFEKIISERFSSVEEIQRSVSQLAKLQDLGGEPHPLAALSWEMFPATAELIRHHLASICAHGSLHGDLRPWLEAWAATSEAAFFGLGQPEDVELAVEVCSDAGEWMPLTKTGWAKLDYLLPPALAPAVGRTASHLGTYRFVLQYQTAPVNPRATPSVDVRVHPSRAAQATVLEARARESGLEVVVDLERMTSSDAVWREEKFTIMVGPKPGCPCFGGHGAAAVTLFSPHPTRPSLLVIDRKSPRAAPEPLPARPWRGFDPQAPSTGAVTLKSSGGEVTVITTNAGGHVPVIAGTQLKRAPSQDLLPVGMAFVVPPFDDEVQLSLGSEIFALSRPSRRGGHVSPIIASVTGEEHVPPGAEDEQLLIADPRGRIEEWLSTTFLSGSPEKQELSSLGTCLLALKPGISSGKIGRQGPGGVFTDMQSLPVYSYPRDDEAEVEAFWHSFWNLGLPAPLGDATSASWPSARSLRGIDSSKVEDYLDAYLRLLKRAKGGMSSGLRAYPFSALLLDENRMPCGVLLSPLHPIRLAWSHAAQYAGALIGESAAYGACREDFLAFVNGHELPIIGPDPAAGPYRWLSAPLAQGHEDFFAAWHLLLADNRVGQMSNVRVLNRSLPLAAPSGLDRGGVIAAIEDYRRVYPVATQLRVGIQPDGERPRLRATDEAIIEAATTLLSQRPSELPGGIRVIDDAARAGDPPYPSELLERGIDSPPFEWSVRTMDDAEQIDMAFVEGSPVRTGVDGIAESHGTGGPAIPLSRFKAWSSVDVDHGRSSVFARPSPVAYGSAVSFRQALTTLECMAVNHGAPVLRSQLVLPHGAAVANARWTVTGNKNIDPAMLSSSMAGNGQGFALWEWRPAWLSGSGGRRSPGLSTSHPYTVLTPNSAIRVGVIEKLVDVGVEQAGSLAEEVLHVLGSRGIGLSSLLAIGGTHAMGALGFWFAYRLLVGWEIEPAQDEVRTLLPLDAVYPLLEVLRGGRSGSGDVRRRADLLLIAARLDRGARKVQLRLQPVEVKARRERGAFPSPTGSKMRDAFEQLEATSGLLTELQVNHRDEGREQPLVGSALANLLETAFALRPHAQGRDHERDSDILSLVASGSVSVEVEEGLVAWFQAGGNGSGGAGHESHFGDKRCLIARFDTACNHRLFEAAKDDLIRLISAGSLPSAGAIANGKPPSSSATGAASRPSGAEAQGAGQAMSAGGSARGGAVVAAGLDEDRNVANSDIQEGIEVLIGHTQRGGRVQQVSLKPSETALNQLNIGVVGDLGTGKTQFLKSLVYQLATSAASNRGHAPKFFVFDYKQDYLSEDFIEEVGAQVLDPEKKPLPVNFFALPEGAGASERVRRANFFRDVLVRVSNIGQVQGHRIYECIMDAYADCAEGHSPTMADVQRRYSDQTGGKGDSVLSVLRLLVDLEVFEPDGSRTMTFGELFSQSTVLNLSGLSGAGQEVTDIVATIFIDLLYNDHMKRLEKHPFLIGPDGVQRRQVSSFVLIDEAHHAMARGFDVLMKMMLEGREFGLGVILSSQYLSHFSLGGKNWAEPLSTWMVHRVNNAKQRDFERIGFQGKAEEMSATVHDLEVHWAYFRCANGYNEGILLKGQPFFSLPHLEAAE